MLSDDETQNILLPKAVDVPTVTVVPAGALQSVAQPAVGNPSLDLVVVCVGSGPTNWDEQDLIGRVVSAIVE